MNKKIIGVILGILIVLVMIATIILISIRERKGQNDIAKVDDKNNSNESQKYALIEDLPKYNNYKYYELKDAVNQEWFSKIGIAEEVEQGGSISSPVYYSDVTLGYDKENNKEYLYPDTIIVQGRLDVVGSGYGQTIIKKSQYDTDDGYKFFRNVLEIGEYSDEKINELMKKTFELTDEQISAYVKLMDTISVSEIQKQKNIEEITNGFYDEINKNIPWKLYHSIGEKDFQMGFGVWCIPNQMKQIIAYSMKVDGGCGDQYIRENGDGKYRIILVYDDLKVNVNIPYSVNDEIRYKATFMYNSGIINEEAYNAYRNSYNR